MARVTWVICYYCVPTWEALHMKYLPSSHSIGFHLKEISIWREMYFEDTRLLQYQPPVFLSLAMQVEFLGRSSCIVILWKHLIELPFHSYFHFLMGHFFLSEFHSVGRVREWGYYNIWKEGNAVSLKQYPTHKLPLGHKVTPWYDNWRLGKELTHKLETKHKSKQRIKYNVAGDRRLETPWYWRHHET